MDETTTAIDPEEAASAFFEHREDADRAEARLKAAGFTDDALYVVPRSPGVTVTVVAGERVQEASDILEAAGGELREADVNASGSVMFRLSPRQSHPGGKPAPADEEDSGLFRRSQDEDGAGTASGGALY